MGKANIDVEVDKKSVERTIRALKRGLQDGAYESAKWAAGEYEDKAKDVIRGRRMWNREVYHGFRQKHRRKNRGAYARVYNPVQHAEIVNWGRRPGQEAPQAQHIIEWVDDKVFAQLISDGGFDDDNLDAGDAWEDHPVVTRNQKIESIEPIEDLDRDEADTDTANSSDLRKVTFENGDSGLFQPHDGGTANPGVTHNEVAYHRLLEEFDFKEDVSESFPETRFWSILDDGEKRDGVMMAWSEEGAGRPVLDHLRTSHEPDNFRQVEDWLDPEEYRAAVARIGVMDYLTGNHDRHYGNMLYGREGRPIAIDNGGQGDPRTSNFTSQKFRRNFLKPVDTIYNLNTKPFGEDLYLIFDPEKARRHAEDIIDRQEQFLQYLSDNPDVREELFETMQDILPDDSNHLEFYEQAWLPGSDWRYAIFEEDDYDWGGREMWEWDIKQIRDDLEQAWQDRMDDDSRVGPYEPDSSPEQKVDVTFGTPDSGVLGDIHDDFDDL